MKSLYLDPWKFPPLGWGKEKGMNNNSDMFKHLDSLGLETAQNCRNSCAKDLNGNDLEVTVEYRLKNIDRKFFPGIDDYQKRLESSIEHFKNKDSSTSSSKSTGKEIKILERAISLLKAQNIPVLTIRDFGTKGLIGQEKEELSPYYRLIKSTGISAKQGSNAGSYGHGQNALIAKSNIKAYTLYSHFKNEKGDKQTLFAGNSILCTHLDPSTNEKTQDTGFIGKIINHHDLESYRNDDLQNISFPYKRLEDGTDIYVWGFNYDQLKWDLYLAMGLIKGFFQAIREKKINFKIVDDNNNKTLHQISSQNLDEYYLLLENQVKERMGLKAWNKEMQSIYGFLKTSCDKNKIPISAKREVFNIEVKGTSQIELTIYQDKDDHRLTKDWCLMRLPLMKIRNFKKSIGIPFNAVCKVLSDEGNEIIMNLEDPTHLILNKTYADVSGPECWGFYLELNKKVNEIIEKLDPYSTESQDIPGLADLIPDLSSSDNDDTFLSSDGKNIKNSNDEGLNPSIKTGELANTLSSHQNKSSSISKKRTASSTGTTGGTEGTVKSEKKVIPSPHDFGIGAGTNKGNASLNPQGKKDSLINNEDIKLRILRVSNSSNQYLLRIVALKDIYGHVNLGMVINNETTECIPLPIQSNTPKNRFDIKWNNNKIKDLKMKKNENYDCEITLPSSAEFAISTI